MQEKRVGMGRAPSAAVVALVLVLFALSGLGAGVLSRSALSGLGFFSSSTATTTTLPTATTTATTASSASPSPSTTTTTSTLPPKGFTLHANATPNRFSVGETFTISVTALAADGVTPQGGVPCYLQAPKGENQLFTTWPEPQVTAADGTASWTLTAPTTTPGAYTVEVTATGQSSWTYRFDIAVTLQG